VEEYTIGEKIFVLASENSWARMPDTVEIYINSGIGDTETIRVGWPPEVTSIPLRKVHGGSINTTGITEPSVPSVNNGILGVNTLRDTVLARYTVKGETAVDTAFVRP
jgi:hypothetical protein